PVTGESCRISDGCLSHWNRNQRDHETYRIGLVNPCSREMRLGVGALAFAVDEARMRWLLAAIDQFPVMQAVNRSLILFLLDDRDAMLSGRAGISPYPKNAVPSPSSRGERP